MLKVPVWLAVVLMLPLAACSKADEKKAAPSADESATKDPGAADVTTTNSEQEPDSKLDTKTLPKNEAPAKDYLSKSWAMFMNRVPGGNAEGAGTPADERAKAEAARQKAYALYKKKDDAAAIPKYEEALNHWATGEIYYQYANSLSNIPRLEDSVKAYEIALQLGYEEPEKALYNTACAYSRMEQAEPAYAYLAKAIHRGYNAFQFIEKDKDMKFLRSQPDWKKRIEALVPEEVRIGKDKYVGTLEVMTPRDPESYILCSNGKLIFDSYVASDGSCCGATYKGTWSVDSGDLVVNWQETCSSKASGELEVATGACDQYDTCSDKVCAPYDEGGGEKMILLQREELAEMHKRKGAEPVEDGEARVVPFEGAEPDVCK